MKTLEKISCDIIFDEIQYGQILNFPLDPLGREPSKEIVFDKYIDNDGCKTIRTQLKDEYGKFRYCTHYNNELYLRLHGRPKDKQPPSYPYIRRPPKGISLKYLNFSPKFFSKFGVPRASLLSEVPPFRCTPANHLKGHLNLRNLIPRIFLRSLRQRAVRRGQNCAVCARVEGGVSAGGQDGPSGRVVVQLTKRD